MNYEHWSSAFSYCSSLTTITIPEGVTSIGWSAFSNCSSLTATTCEAATPPTIGNSDTFYNVDKSIPVYVPTGSVSVYKRASYWSEFTNIQPLAKSVTEITINQTSAILTEGESITLTVTVTPEDADDTSVTWSSSDEDVAMVSSKGRVITLAAGTTTITAYATKENYEDSDVATLTLCWIPCTEEHESEEDGILTIPSKSVLISARDGVLTLSGLAEGTEVTLYTTDGAKVAHQQSSAGEATFTVDTNQVYLVHIGDKVVKIGM